MKEQYEKRRRCAACYDLVNILLFICDSRIRVQAFCYLFSINDYALYSAISICNYFVIGVNIIELDRNILSAGYFVACLKHNIIC